MPLTWLVARSGVTPVDRAAVGGRDAEREPEPAEASFTPEHLAENYGSLLDEYIRLKPASAKGIYLKKITVSATQGPGVPVDTSVEKNYATK